MKLLITGGSGFLGTHLSKLALQKGYEVVSYDLEPPKLDEVTWVEGDVRNFDLSTLSSIEPDALAHLAGILGTAEQIDNPEPSVRTNILGTLNVLEALKDYKEISCFQLSNGNYDWLATYPITKETAAKFALMYNQEFGTKMAVLRVMNAYGEYQKVEPIQKIIPTFVAKALNGEDLEVYGDGKQIADLVYAGDVAKVMLKVLEDDFDCYDQILEVGSGIPHTVNEIADQVIDIVGNPVEKEHIPMRPGEPQKSVTIARKPEVLKREVGYLPDTDLKKGLEETVQWYRKKF